METLIVEVPGVQVPAVDVLSQIKGGNEQESLHNVYRLLGLTPGKVLEVSIIPEYKHLAQTFSDLFNMTLICDLVNKNEDGTQWVADWSDGDQRKWTPWLQFIPGSGFRFDRCYYVYDFTSLGARPALRTEELAKWVYETFPQLCNRLAEYNSKQTVQ